MCACLAKAVKCLVVSKYHKMYTDKVTSSKLVAYSYYGIYLFLFFVCYTKSVSFIKFLRKFCIASYICVKICTYYVRKKRYVLATYICIFERLKIRSNFTCT